jgi:hypothetical protein
MSHTRHAAQINPFLYPMFETLTGPLVETLKEDSREEGHY